MGASIPVALARQSRELHPAVGQAATCSKTERVESASNFYAVAARRRNNLNGEFTAPGATVHPDQGVGTATVPGLICVASARRRSRVARTPRTSGMRVARAD
jgi:hypothetical protein